MPILQQIIDAPHFAELKAYKNRNTLSPDVWGAMAEQSSWLYMGATGTLVEPLRFLPIRENNVEELRRRRNELADRKIDQVFGEE